MKNPNQLFADRLRELRQAKGWSMYRLAQVSGVSKQTLSVLEQGDTNPGWQTVQQLARALDVATDDFVVLEAKDARKRGK
jgi:transcriptional regulator with XRE-family HTH domain